MSARNRELMISEVNNTIKSVKLISKSGECARKILGKRMKMIRIRRQKSIRFDHQEIRIHVHSTCVGFEYFYLSDVEVQQLHHEAVGAPVGYLRRALHEVVVRRAQSLEHVTLAPERAVIF